MTDPSTSDAAQQLQAKLQALWESSKPTILERLKSLNASQQQLATDPENLPAKQKGAEAAHKLAGILGVFGLPEGSKIASQIEQMLEHAYSSASSETFQQLIEQLNRIIATKDAS
jgi:HPt (histidine-containing phosphotransfer) domain-containing protein